MGWAVGLDGIVSCGMVMAVVCAGQDLEEPWKRNLVVGRGRIILTCEYRVCGNGEGIPSVLYAVLRAVMGSHVQDRSRVCNNIPMCCAVLAKELTSSR